MKSLTIRFHANIYNNTDQTERNVGPENGFVEVVVEIDTSLQDVPGGAHGGRQRHDSKRDELFAVELAFCRLVSDQDGG